MKKPTIENEQLQESYQNCVNLQEEIVQTKKLLKEKRKDFRAARKEYRQLFRLIEPPGKLQRLWTAARLGLYENLQARAEKLRKKVGKEEENLLSNIGEVVEMLKKKADLTTFDRAAAEQGMKVLSKFSNDEARKLETQLQGMLA